MGGSNPPTVLQRTENNNKRHDLEKGRYPKESVLSHSVFLFALLMKFSFDVCLYFFLLGLFSHSCISSQFPLSDTLPLLRPSRTQHNPYVFVSLKTNVRRISFCQRTAANTIKEEGDGWKRETKRENDTDKQ